MLTIKEVLDLTFDDVPKFYKYEETRGVGKNRGTIYRRFKVDALNEKGGSEHKYRVQIDSTGRKRVDDLGVTSRQLRKDDLEEWNSLPENCRKFVERHWPNLNQCQKNTLAKIAAGEKVNPLEAQAVLGGAARHKFCELFPGVQTFGEAFNVMKQAAADDLFA